MGYPGKHSTGSRLGVRRVTLPLSADEPTDLAD